MTVVGDYYATVNDISLDTFAWRVVDKGYDDLLSSPALRGQSLVMNGATGRRPYKRIVDETPVTIYMHIYGAVDEDGDPTSDAFDGMFTHRDYLNANLGIASASGDGTVELVFNRGTTLDPVGADVTVLGLNDFTVIDRVEGVAVAHLDLVIPAGVLVSLGS